MGELVPIRTPLTADDKRWLIQSAHADLVGARAIDEQETLGDAEAVVWYDEVLPQVTNIKVIAGALEAELTIRRGRPVEQRGGDRTSEQGREQTYAVSKFANNETKKRSEDRLIATHESAVRTYVKNCISQDKAPSRRAMLRVAHLAKGGGRKPRTKEQPEKKRSPQDVPRVYQALYKLAVEDRALSDSEIHAVTRMSVPYLHHASVFIPWLRRTKTAEGLIRFTIDAELREICEGKRPRPQLRGASLAQELRTLRSEITQRRKERDLYIRKSNWDHLTSHAKFIIELMNWIEGELERVSTLL